jgi:hypothetical protein
MMALVETRRMKWGTRYAYERGLFVDHVPGGIRGAATSAEWIVGPSTSVVGAFYSHRTAVTYLALFARAFDENRPYFDRVCEPLMSGPLEREGSHSHP